MFEKVLGFLARLWSVKTPWQNVFSLEEPPDVIACVSYGLDQERRLTNFTSSVVNRAAILARRFPRAVIVFGCAVFAPSSGVPDTSEEERAMKMTIFGNFEISNKIIFAGPTLTTIDESERFRDALYANGIPPRRIIVVDGEAHSPSTRYVWQRGFPSAEIAFELVPFRCETQPDHVMKLARKPILWFGANVARHTLLCLLGMNFVRRFVQPASE